MQKQVNKSEWDGSDIIFLKKSLANVTKTILLKISTYSIFGHWQGAGRNSKFA